MKKLSIIIPLFNTENYIAHCIQSCVDQNIEKVDYEIIIVNDGSTDNSLHIAQLFERKYTNVTVISQENRKQGAARNNGLKIAEGEYIWFIDSDDWIEPDAIQEIFNYLKNNNLDILRFDGANRHSYIDKAKILPCQHIPRKIYLRHEVLIENKFFISPPLHVFKKDFLMQNKITYLENIFYEDNEFMLKTFEKASSFAYLDKYLYNILIREDSTTRLVNYSRKLDLVVVIESLIAYHRINNLNQAISYTFAIQISRCTNSLLSGTAKSKDVFNEAVRLLRNVKGLSYYIKHTNSYFHIFELHLLKYPEILRNLLLIFYKN